MNWIDLCREAIGIDSTPSQGNAAVVRWAEKLLRDRGFQVETLSDYHGDSEHLSLVARPHQATDVDFLFQNHLDTMEPGPYQLWVENFKNPFEATIKDGKIFGLGAVDGKVDFVCKVVALSEFLNQKKWKMSPVIVITAGAHQGMTGALKVIRKNKIAAKMALIGEASSLELIHAAPGYATVEIRIPFSDSERRYKEDHDLMESTSTQSKFFVGSPSTHPLRDLFSYLEQLPENLALIEVDGGSHFNAVPSSAILEFDMASVKDPVSNKLRSIYKAVLQLEDEFKKVQDPEFSPAYSTLNLGVLRTFDDYVMLLGSVRILPRVHAADYEQWIEKIRRQCEALGATFRVRDFKKPFRVDENSLLIRGGLAELQKLGMDSKLRHQNATTEASLFSRIGIECLCFGPGQRERNIFTPTEHVPLSEAEKSISFYRAMIERFCL